MFRLAPPQVWGGKQGDSKRTAPPLVPTPGATGAREYSLQVMVIPRAPRPGYSVASKCSLDPCHRDNLFQSRITPHETGQQGTEHRPGNLCATQAMSMQSGCTLLVTWWCNAVVEVNLSACLAGWQGEQVALLLLIHLVTQKHRLNS